MGSEAIVRRELSNILLHLCSRDGMDVGFANASGDKNPFIVEGLLVVDNGGLDTFDLGNSTEDEFSKGLQKPRVEGGGHRIQGCNVFNRT